jgi:hypothetical protein
MKISTRVDSIGGEHVHFSLFMNGKAGELCLKIHEYERFKIVLEQGATMVERQEVSIEPLPLPPRVSEALSRLAGHLGELAILNEKPTELEKDVSTLYHHLTGTLLHEDHPNATEDDASPRSDQPSTPGPDGANAQQLQGNRNDELSNRDGQSAQSPNSRGVGEGSGGTPSIPSGSKIPSFF